MPKRKTRRPGRRPPHETRQSLRERAGNRCEQCGAGEGLSIHHRLPFSQGGDHSLPNLLLLCPACHYQADREEGVVVLDPRQRRSAKGSGR